MTLIQKIIGFLGELFLKLPDSPVQTWLSNLTGMDKNLLGFINYFVPFDLAIIILENWIALMIGIYVFKLALTVWKK